MAQIGEENLNFRPELFEVTKSFSLGLFELSKKFMLFVSFNLAIQTSDKLNWTLLLDIIHFIPG